MLGMNNHNRGRKLPAEPLTPDEARRLLAAPSRRAPTGIRNRALLILLWRGGLRVSEALALKSKDLDAQQGTIRVLEGKGRKARTIGLDPESWPILQQWAERRAKLGINGDRPFICTLSGTAVSTQYVRALMPRLARRAGIEKRVHAHGLRHTMASELRQEGVEMGVISKQLGHANIATTSRYLDHVCPQAVIQAMAHRKWS